ncbi:MAG: nucleoside triphosphate pyrophosphohydrolase [Anaerolineae bacterium]|nr:nucleoside triphosphate pyrophosphohydrolase [Anaerolineae bacterium]
MITIVGLGPGNPAHLTLEAWQVLEQVSEVYLRTARHPIVSALPAHLTVHSFDALYEQASDFAEVYEEIAAQVLALGQRPEGVVYAVPGHPLVGEATVQRVLEEARARNLATRVVAGLSFIEPVLTALGLDALDGLQVVDALDLAARHHPPFTPDLPVLVGQLYGRDVASGVKLTLMNAYPAEHLVTLVRSAGTNEEWMRTLPLYELDRVEDVDHLTTLYVPPLPGVGGVETFQDTIARLRAPGGCPWDRKQTHRSLRINLLEETYEVLSAIDRDDMPALCEELGDLLLQIALHTQIAVEEGDFSLADVVAGIDTKIKRRHPHVFGDVQVNGVSEVLHNWEKIKREERAGREEGKRFMLDGVPRTLPALARAQSLQRRVARMGFEWRGLAEVMSKVAEELAELQAATTAEARELELGDVLFVLVSLARWLDVDAESALRATCDRFTRRFAAVEKLCRERGLEMGKLSPAEWEMLWREVKVNGSNPNDQT